MNLSVREASVLAAIASASLINSIALSNQLELPTDELDLVLQSLAGKAAIRIADAARGRLVVITRIGREAIEASNRG